MELWIETKEIILKGGVIVKIPIKFEYDKCKGCKANDIIWAMTIKNKRPMPIRWDEIQGEWISHFIDCPNASEFRKKK
jgi:hypothetical protein